MTGDSGARDAAAPGELQGPAGPAEAGRHTVASLHVRGTPAAPPASDATGSVGERSRSDEATGAPTRSVPPFHWWRTVFLLIPLIGCYTIVLGSISLLSSLFDRTGDFGHRCARLWSHLILRTTGVHVAVRGLEHLDGIASCVLASNHQSIYDIPIVFASVPLQLRIVAKASLGSFPFLGWHLRRTGHLLVDRQNPGADIVDKMRRLVGEAHSLIVFPEGTRSGDGQVGRFKKGSFLVAIDAGLPVVPVSIAGSRHVMRKGRLMVCPGEVRVTVHEPIQSAGVAREDVIAFATRVRDIVRRAVDEPDERALREDAADRA